jgi:hypothetical protein
MERTTLTGQNQGYYIFIRPIIQVPHPWMEEEEEDDEWQPQQFYPNVISEACSRACWW